MLGNIIYDDNNYTAAAKWCNENNAHIEEISADEQGQRRFQIVANPEPTEEELSERERLRVEAEAEAQRVPDLEDATVELAEYVVSLEERIAELEAKLEANNG